MEELSSFLRDNALVVPHEEVSQLAINSAKCDSLSVFQAISRRIDITSCQTMDSGDDAEDDESSTAERRGGGGARHRRGRGFGSSAYVMEVGGSGSRDEDD